MDYTTYCRNNTARQNASCRISPDQPPVYTLDGVTYTQEEFEQAFPLSGKLTDANDKKYLKGENVDTTHKWMFE